LPGVRHVRAPQHNKFRHGGPDDYLNDSREMRESFVVYRDLINYSSHLPVVMLEKAWAVAYLGFT
jgi:hypothetical protein